MRHIMLMVMSPFAESIVEKIYTDATGDFEASCIHTNETAVRYVDWALREKHNTELERIYAFVSEEVNASNRKMHIAKDDHSGDEMINLVEESAYSRFMNLIAPLEIPMEDVTLFNNGDLQGSFVSVSAMYDKLVSDLGNDMENTVIHIDMTGGPRHTSMLMLALIHLLVHDNAKIGYVLYTNFQNNVIEDATDVLEMFDLIAATHEFTAFGSVDYLKAYFNDRKEKSIELRHLLDSMEDFSEALKICVGKDELRDKISCLSKAINDYNDYLETPSGQSVLEKERFFSKLLTTIKKEYAAILPDENGEADLLDIIEWCMNRNFLQQSVTLFTEWLPSYIVDAKILEIKKKVVIDECNMLTASHETWANYLLRKFDGKFFLEQAKQAVKARMSDEQSSVVLTYTQLMEIVKQREPNVLVLKARVQGKSQGLYSLAKELIKIDNLGEEENPVEKVLAYPEGSGIHFIINNFKYNNCDARTFLTTRSMSTKMSYILLQMLGLIKKETLISFFPMAVGTPITKDVQREIKNEFKKYPRTVAANPNGRRKILDKLVLNGYMDINMDQEQFYDILGLYFKCVYDWRNKFNHAMARNGCKKTSENIKSEILEAINLIRNRNNKGIGE